MRCLLHIGTEKTGSSYLQCKLALARTQLLRDGIWFSYGAPFDEDCMKMGRISGGNALKVAEEMEQGDWDSVSKRMTTAREDAAGRGASCLLISSELLLRPLSVDGRVSSFVDILKGLGFEHVEFFIVLRDPADQLLSLYKHRAKRGTAGSLESWCESGYMVPQELAGLRQQLGRPGVSLTACRYDRSDGALERLFFEDWLDVAAPVVDMPSTVNPSLTFSELAMIQQLASLRSGLVSPFYDALIALGPEKKARNHAKEQYARALAAQTVAAYSDEWIAWNNMLPEGEQLIVPDAPDSFPPCSAELSFSDEQAKVLARLLCEAATPGFIVGRLWNSKLRPSIGRLARTLGLIR